MFALQLHETLTKYELNINDFYTVDYNSKRAEVKLQAHNLTDHMPTVTKLGCTLVGNEHLDDRFHVYQSHIHEPIDLELTYVDPLDDGAYEELISNDPNILLAMPKILDALHCTESDFYNIAIRSLYGQSLREISLQGKYTPDLARRLPITKCAFTESGFIEASFNDILGRQVRIILT